MAVSHMLPHVSAGDWIGYIAALLVFLTFWMKTMVSLGTAGIASNFLFIAYGYLVAAYPPLILHVFLLPLNLMRLREMLQLTKRVEAAYASPIVSKLAESFGGYTSITRLKLGNQCVIVSTNSGSECPLRKPSLAS